MNNLRNFIAKKEFIYISGLIALFILVLFLLCIYAFYNKAHVFQNFIHGIIVVDPGHGGIDGGTSADGILEKDINLDIAKKLKSYLDGRGYKVILTREKDVSLDNLSKDGGSRHQRDLNSRVNLFNNSRAEIFLSIHVDSNFNNPKANGSIVFYNEKYPENENLAYCIQRELNGISASNYIRTARNPQKGNYYILYYSKIPGVIIETAFISNTEERRLLKTEEFKELVAKKITDGVEKYFLEMKLIKNAVN